jgi:hypothetical protein
MVNINSQPDNLLQLLAEGDFEALKKDAKRMQEIASKVNLQPVHLSQIL